MAISIKTFKQSTNKKGYTFMFIQKPLCEAETEYLYYDHNTNIK